MTLNVLFFTTACGVNKPSARPIVELNEVNPPAAKATATPTASTPPSASPPSQPADALPKETALGIAFVDTDPEAGIVQGEIQIQKAADESSIVSYIVYWGSSASAKLEGSVPIAALSKTGANLNVTLQAGTVVPQNATHLLVFTKNDAGEKANGVSTDLLDVGLPTEPALSIGFTDTNSQPGKLAGELSITRAFDESELDDYLPTFITYEM